MRQVIADIGCPCGAGSTATRCTSSFDLDPASGYLDALAEREERADVASLRAVLAPRSVVVVGAGRRAGRWATRCCATCSGPGSPAALAAVNPHAAQVCGVACHRSVAGMPEPADLAVVCVPAAAVPDVAEQCGRRGVRALLVISSGLSADPGWPAACSTRSAATTCGWSGRTASASPTPIRPCGWTRHSPRRAPAGCGRAGHAVRRGRRSRCRSSCAGWARRVDHGVGRRQVRRQRQRPAAVVARRRADPDGGAATWSRSATRASSPGSPGGWRSRMPVLTVAVGQLGGRAAGGGVAHRGHGDSAGDPRRAVPAGRGTRRATGSTSWPSWSRRCRWQPLPAGRVAVISNAGGAGVLAADACVAHGLAVSPLSDRTQRALRRLLPARAATINPVDTTAVVTPSEVSPPRSPLCAPTRRSTRSSR